jgi:hypothetical protein
MTAMNKFALALVIAAIAASPAAAAKKKAKRTVGEPVKASVHGQSTAQDSINFAKDSLPIFLPSWSMPVYMGVSARKD